MANSFICSTCDGRLFRRLYGHLEGNEHDQPHSGTHRSIVGWECVECGEIQITGDVPETHETQHGLPNNAVDKRSTDGGSK